MTRAGDPLWTRPEVLAAGTAPAGRRWQTPDVLVIGGGVAGLGVAAWCRMRGLGEVVVVEQGAIARGPSGRAAGALIPDVHALTHPAPFAALARRGLELHGGLHERWGARSTLRRARCLVLPPRVAEPVELPDQGSLDPCALAAGLTGECGAVLTSTPATGWDVEGGRVVRVRTSAGDVHPGSVVVATGGWAHQMPSQDRHAPVVAPVKGHLVATAPLPSPLEEIVVTDVIAVPGPDGRVIAGGTFDVGDDLPDVRAAVVDHLRSALARAVPATAGVELTHAWTCFRPAATDGLPIVDRLAGLSNAWSVAGLHHTGLLTAPAIGESVAEWIATGRQPALVAPFTADRLTAAP